MTVDYEGFVRFYLSNNLWEVEVISTRQFEYCRCTVYKLSIIQEYFCILESHIWGWSSSWGWDKTREVHIKRVHPCVDRAELLNTLRAPAALLSSIFWGLLWKWSGPNSLFPWVLRPTIQITSTTDRIGDTGKGMESVHICVSPRCFPCAQRWTDLHTNARTTINFGVTPSFQIPLLHLCQPAQTTVARNMRDSKAEHSRKSEPSSIF